MGRVNGRRCTALFQGLQSLAAAAQVHGDGLYIKRWVPELADWPAKAIHRMEKDSAGYLTPIVDLRASAEEIKARFRGLKDAHGLI